MNLKDKISLDKVFEKEYKKKHVELENNKEAVITHFLHNSKNGVSQFFKKDAVKYTKEILQYEYPKEEISNIVAEEALQYGIFDTFEVPFPPVENPKFKFIDLFAGIGGFRLAMQNLDGKCVFTSEWDKDAKRTYKANFGERPFGDITKEETKAFIPDNFDLLCAGFPCQAFSIAGKRGGFEDTRGTLFFEINTLGKFNMYGDFQVYQGYYNFKYGGLLEKRFEVKKYGSIVWNGDPMAATLNLEAVYKVVGGANPGVLIDNPSFNRKVEVDVIIGINGSLMNPEPDFNIEFPNVASTLRSELQYKLDDKDTRQTQALSLLTSNSFLSSEGLSQSQPTNLLFEKARSLFADIFATSDGKMTIAPDYVGADNRPGFETDGRFGLTLSSQINDRITINGKVGVPVGTSVNESSAVVGDVELQYRVNDDGSLNLRVFNRENDVTYIGQGVGYTQGLGISYQVDFDTFKELVAKVFKNKKLKTALPTQTEIEDSSLPDNFRFNTPPKQDKKTPSETKPNSNKEGVPSKED